MPVADPNSPEERLKTAYSNILSDPFEEKYEDTWEEDTYWAAVESFKLKIKEIGIDDPFEILKKFNITSYESIRDRLKAGPPACLRAGWKSPYIGAKIDPVAVIAPLKHVHGPEFSGQERIVVLDFWATWYDSQLFIDINCCSKRLILNTLTTHLLIYFFIYVL